MTDSTFPGATPKSFFAGLLAKESERYQLIADGCAGKERKAALEEWAEALRGSANLIELLRSKVADLETERDALKAEVQRLREALDKFVDCQIAGGRAWDEPKLYEALHHAWDLIRKLDPPRVP